ncbi:MAG TPA: hypothetical protein VGB85_33945, partial [Nannocystis sp.]
MSHRSPTSIFAVAGLLALVAGPALAQAPAVPPPTAPITPATPGSEVVEAVPVSPPAETVPAAAPATAPAPAAAPAPATPAPTPYAGPGTTPPLTAPPGSAAPRPYVAPGSDPAARPGFDFGGQALAPLPPPPAALDPGKIRRQPWRGRWWLALRMSVTGPVAGEHPAAPSVLALGGGADFGWRVGNVLGLGMGLSGQTHNLKLLESLDLNTGLEGKRTYKGQMLYWDALFARVHLPLKKRFQPYVEAGIGL